MLSPSCIFSFDGWRRAAALPREIKAWMCCVTVTLLVVGTAGVAGLRRAFGDRGKDPAPFAHLSERGLGERDVEILILGDSTVDAAVLPRLLSRPAAKLAVMSSGYELWKLVFDAHVDSLPNLDTLVVQLNPMSLMRPGLSQRHGDYRDLIALGVDPFRLPRIGFGQKLKSFVQHDTYVSPAFGGPKLDFEGLERALVAHSPDGGPHWSPAEGRKKKRGYIGWLSRVDARSVNLPAFRGLLATAKRRKLRVVFVRCPETAEFFAESRDQWEAIQDQLLAYAREILGPGRFEVLLGPKLPGFGHELFKDPNHTNEAGARKFTAQLDRLLRRDNR